MKEHDLKALSVQARDPRGHDTAPSQRRPGGGEPRHLGVILDGNRRWAQDHGASLETAYAQGASRVRDLVSWCEQSGIAIVTVWALSRSNLQRAPMAVGHILDAVATGMERIAAAGRWRIRLIGDISLLPVGPGQRLCVIADRTASRSTGILNVAVAYDGRADIVSAIRRLVQPGVIDAEAATVIREADVERHLSTAGLPNIDLLIRTSGEQRLSGFMPWQTAYAELYFTATPWPAFSFADFTAALNSYQTRQRRFGR